MMQNQSIGHGVRNFLKILCISIVLLNCPLVWAEEPVFEIDKIVISAPTESFENERSGYISTTIDEKSELSLPVSSQIQGQAGVHVLRFGGLERSTSVSLRGSSTSQVSVYLDGIPLDTASSQGIGLNHIAAQSLAKISIYKGMSPIENGMNQVGGVINLSSKVPDQKQEYRFQFYGGSFLTLGGLAEGRWKFDRSSMVFHFDYQQTDGDYSFLDDNGTPLNASDDRRVARQNNFSRLIHPYLKWIYELDDRHSLDFVTHFFRIDSGVPGLGSFQSQAANRDLTEILGRVSFQRKRFWKDGLWKATVAWRFIKSQFSDPNGEVGLGAGQDNDNKTMVLNSRFFFEKPVAKFYKIQAQIEHVFERFLPKDFLAANPIGSESLRQQLNFSVSNSFQFWKKRLKIQLQAWLGNAFYDINDNDPSLTTPGRFTSIKTEHPISASLGFSLQPLNGFYIKGSVSRAERLPKFSELFGDQGFVLGNVALQSEKTIKWDFGLVYQKRWQDKHIEKFRVEAAFFQSFVDDLIQFELGSGVARASNLGSARIHGVEALVALGFLEHFEVSANYTWQRAHDTTRAINRFLIGRPEHDVNFSLSFKKKWLHLSTKMNYVHNQYLDSLNTQAVRNRLQWDAQAQFQVTKKVSIGVEAQNLLGTQIVDAIGFPLPGRSVMGKVSVKF